MANDECTTDSCAPPGTQRNPDGDSRLSVGVTAPDFSIPGRRGAPLRLADLRGRVVLLEFWATWCPPCRASLPALLHIHEHFRDRGVEVISIVTTDSAENYHHFLTDHPEHSWQIVHDAVAQEDSIGYQRYTISGFPTFFVIDGGGQIVFSEKGMLDPARKARLWACLEQLLGEAQR